MNSTVFGDYEWDENKRLENYKKHGIDFIDACQIFDDIHFIIPSSKIKGREQRRVAIGLLKEKEVLVVFTERYDKKRIISARRAKRKERKRFWEAFNQSDD